MTLDQRQLPVGGTALLLGLSAALLFFRLGVLPLVGPDEPRYARVAVEMHRSGDLVTPTLQGQPWLEKPPLYYWLASAAFWVLGETETAARLPSVLACLALIGTTALVGARLYGGAAGLHSGFILGTAGLPFVYGRAAAMDMLLAATVTIAVGLLALRLLGIAGPLAVPVAYAFIGLAALAKGPIGFLLPGLIVSGYILATREWRLVARVVSPGAILALLVVAVPWYALVYRAQGQAFVDVFLLNHNVQRFTSTIHRHPGPFYYYAPLVVAGLFPWSGLALPALIGLRAVASRVDRFVLLWLLLPFAFFSAAGSKLPGYILPCLPPLALLMGRAADDIVNRRSSWSATRAAALIGLLLGSLLATTPYLLARQGGTDWVLAVPFGLWSLIVAFLFSRRVDADPIGALGLLRVGAAGALLLLTHAAIPILEARESGRGLFLPARQREVLVWGAWRTAWMAGYFYNDARVREVSDLAEISNATANGPVLVLCGPAEKRRIDSLGTLKALVLAQGPRDNTLVRVERR